MSESNILPCLLFLFIIASIVSTKICNSGTYLSDDLTTCIDCPAGYFCPDGTAKYDCDKG